MVVAGKGCFSDELFVRHQKMHNKTAPTPPERSTTLWRCSEAFLASTPHVTLVSGLIGRGGIFYYQVDEVFFGQNTALVALGFGELVWQQDHPGTNPGLKNPAAQMLARSVQPVCAGARATVQHAPTSERFDLY